MAELTQQDLIRMRAEARNSAHGGNCPETILRLCDTVEELRARLEQSARERDEAREALGKALKGLQCHVNGLPAELCGCKFCRGLQAALGAAGERGTNG